MVELLTVDAVTGPQEAQLNPYQPWVYRFLHIMAVPLFAVRRHQNHKVSPRILLHVKAVARDSKESTLVAISLATRRPRNVDLLLIEKNGHAEPAAGSTKDQMPSSSTNEDTTRPRRLATEKPAATPPSIV